MSTAVPSAPVHLGAQEHLRTAGGGRFLIGRSPSTVLTLSAAGAGAVRDWFAGSAVAETGPGAALADRLERRNLAARRFDTTAAARLPVSIIVPVKDDADGLGRTLASVARDRPRPARIVVVDDGSTRPLLSDSAPPFGAQQVTVVRRPVSGGPGVARNHGLGVLTAEHSADDEVVIFVDAGIELCPGTANGLAAVLAGDPGTVAVAPRIRSASVSARNARRTRALADYELRHSPLDLGSVPGLVGPGDPISYVPTAVLAVRRSALDALATAGPVFDPDLRYGEDVDLVWRLLDLGTVRYRPELIATHPPRGSWRALAHQRFGYGTAAGPLAARHGDALSPLRVGPWPVVAASALTIRSLPLALGGIGLASALATRTVARRLPEDLPGRTVEATRMIVDGQWRSLSGTGGAMLRSWWPVAIVAVVVPGPLRRLVCRLIVLGVVRRVSPSAPGKAVGDALAGAVDDVSYGAGLWWGVLRPSGAGRAARRARLRALLPVLKR